MSKPSILIFLLALLLGSAFSTSSCVSKKKFTNEVARRANCDSTLQQLNSHNLLLNGEIAELKLKLAEKTGEAKAFWELIDKQDKQIDRLNKEIEKMTDQSLSQQTTLDGALQLKSQTIAEKEAIIQGLKDAVAAQRQQLQELLDRISAALPEYSSDDLSMEIKKGLGHIRISEQLLFRKGTTRLNSRAYAILEKIANVLMEYPQTKILVVGHTDNKPVKSRSLKDNWDLSVLRATPIVRMLTKDLGLSPNQVTAAGKGEFKPIASNDSSGGREKNRRTELVIYPPVDKILKMVEE